LVAFNADPHRGVLGAAVERAQIVDVALRHRDDPVRGGAPPIMGDEEFAFDFDAHGHSMRLTPDAAYRRGDGHDYTARPPTTEWSLMMLSHRLRRCLALSALLPCAVASAGSAVVPSLQQAQAAMDGMFDHAIADRPASDSSRLVAETFRPRLQTLDSCAPAEAGDAVD